MKTVYEHPKIMNDRPNTYCPGCNHGTAVRLIAEVLEELDVVGNTVAVLPIGCGPMAYINTLNLDCILAAHGRAPAVATGLTRCAPDKFVFTYQGDGDLASIGTAEIIHAANRGEKFSAIFVNNAIFGMTGGQMAPTTLVGQKTTTTPKGRDAEHFGYPVRMSEIISTLEAPIYVERCALNSVANIRKAKKAIRTAFEIQKNKEGFAFVELLSACPTNWKMDPLRCAEFIEKEMIPYYPLGVFKDTRKKEV